MSEPGQSDRRHRHADVEHQRHGGSGIATVAYELAPNGGSFNSQPASWDTTLVSDGLYDLRVVATDVAGNSTTSTLVTTRVDNTAPALTFSSPAASTIVSGTVNLVGSATDASPASPSVTFAYKLASDPPSAYTATGASWNTATLPAGDGIYDLRARATDDASNTATVENTSVRVDNAPPTVSITAPAAAINGSLPSPTTFAANASDPAGSGVTQVQFFECSDQSNDCATGVWNPLGTVPAPGPYSVSWSIPAADGNHALAAVATDNAGHPATAIRNVDVDRTAPSTTILTKPSDPSNLAVPSFTFDSSEPGSTFECSIDGGVVRVLHEPAQRGGPHRQQPHLRRAGDGRGRQHRRDAGYVDLASRHERSDRHAEQPRRQHPADRHPDLDRDGSAGQRLRVRAPVGHVRVLRERHNLGLDRHPQRGAVRHDPLEHHRSHRRRLSAARRRARRGRKHHHVRRSAERPDRQHRADDESERPGPVPTRNQDAHRLGSRLRLGHRPRRLPARPDGWRVVDDDRHGLDSARRVPGQLRYDDRVRRSLRLPDGCVRRRREPGRRDAGHRPSRRQHRADRDHQQPRSIPARRRQPHVFHGRSGRLERLGRRDGRLRVLDQRRRQLAVNRCELQLGRRRRRQCRPARRGHGRGGQHDDLGSSHEPRGQHEARHDGQRSERLAVQPGHRHAHRQRRRLGRQRDRIQRRRQSGLHRRHERRHPGSGRRLERRRAHDRLLLGRQRRQHRDDQEHDRV